LIKDLETVMYKRAANQGAKIITRDFFFFNFNAISSKTIKLMLNYG